MALPKEEFERRKAQALARKTKPLLRRIDEKMRRNGWLALREGEAYEFIIKRSINWVKQKNKYGKDCFVRRPDETAVYIFREEMEGSLLVKDGNEVFDIPPGETIWRTYYVEWKGKTNAQEIALTTPTTFSRAYDAAIKKIRREKNRLEWAKRKQEQREQQEQKQDTTIKKKRLLEKDVAEENEPSQTDHDQLSLF